MTTKTPLDLIEEIAAARTHERNEQHNAKLNRAEERLDLLKSRLAPILDICHAAVVKYPHIFNSSYSNEEANPFYKLLITPEPHYQQPIISFGLMADSNDHRIYVTNLNTKTYDAISRTTILSTDELIPLIMDQLAHHISRFDPNNIDTTL